MHKIGRGYPIVLGHRGASGYAPENTMKSFKLALDMEADGVELDVQMTYDGKLVVIHDELIDRTSNGKGWVKDHTLEELKEFNFNNHMEGYGFCEIPTLDEVLELFRGTGKMINIEIKSNIINYPGITKAVIDMVREHDMQDHVIYSSFNHQTCLEVEEYDPDAYVGFLYEDGFLNVPEYVRQNHGDALHPALYFLLDPLYMPRARKNGLEVNVWTINEEYQMELGCKLGITTIITNYPDKALKIVEKYKKN